MLKKNKFIDTISPSVRLIILFLLVFSLIIAKSLYLFLSITIIVLVLYIITNESANEYIKFFKKIYPLLLILLTTYIIIFSEYNLLKIMLVSGKIIISSFMIKVFEVNISFDELHEAIYGMLYMFKKFNIEKFSLDIAFSLCLIKFWFDSKDQIKEVQILNGKRINGITKFIMPRLLFSIDELNKLQLRLKLNFYKLKYKKVNRRSKLALLVAVAFFIVCIFKEVIL